jgi:carbon monoxide dehydrogenase subunit G
MSVEVAVTVDAPKRHVWRTVSDIEHAASTISAIEKIEVLERPSEGLLGLKWKETRTLFGKSATETMWVTVADEHSYYATEARSHGSIYRTEIHLADQDGGTRLSMTFSAEAQTLGARVMSTVFGFLMNRSLKKALLQDLQDLKKAAESREAPTSVD